MMAEMILFIVGKAEFMIIWRDRCLCFVCLQSTTMPLCMKILFSQFVRQTHEVNQWTPLKQTMKENTTFLLCL